MPLKGSLDEIVAKLDMADVRRAVHTGACNLYHAACHNMLHEQSREVLMELYKTSVFTIQAEYFFKDRELSEKKSRAVSEAERTGSGDFVYCDRDEAEKRKSERQF